jgi:hypothetical protein
MTGVAGKAAVRPRPTVARLIHACRRAQQAYTVAGLEAHNWQMLGRKGAPQNLPAPRPGDAQVCLISDAVSDAQVLVGSLRDHKGARDNDVAGVHACDVHNRHGCETHVKTSVAKSSQFVAFRGTTTRADWGINSRVWLIPSAVGEGARVHSGFMLQWESVRARVFAELDRLEQQAQPQHSPRAVPGCDSAERAILVTGHSLGGALAIVACADIVAQYPGVPVEVITFGAPRCGNRAYIAGVSRLAGSMTRVVHDSDAVPSIPPLLMGYSHCESEWVHLVKTPRRRLHVKATEKAVKMAAGSLHVDEEAQAVAADDSYPRDPVQLRWRTGIDAWWREAEMLWRRMTQREFGVADHHIDRYLEALVETLPHSSSHGGEDMSEMEDVLCEDERSDVLEV